MSLLKTRYLRANPQLKIVPGTNDLTIGMIAGLIVQAMTTQLKISFMRVNEGTAGNVKAAYDQVRANFGPLWSGDSMQTSGGI